MILDCKPIKEQIVEELKEEVSKLSYKPTLRIITAEGCSQASTVYVRNKIKLCEEVGLSVEKINLEYIDRTKEEVLTRLKDLITYFNNDLETNSYFIQLPLPYGITEKDFSYLINPKKDCDAFSYQNLGKLYKGEDSLVSCTPQGIMNIFDYYNINLESKDVVIINRSQIVGIPLIKLMMDRNATVTVCHSRTKELKEKCKRADIIVTAVGKANFLTEDYINPNSIVIDVSMNRDSDNKLCGDFKKDLYDKVAMVTPVPGGVGQLTVVNVIKNVIECAKLQGII